MVCILWFGLHIPALEVFIEQVIVIPSPCPVQVAGDVTVQVAGDVTDS